MAFFDLRALGVKPTGLRRERIEASPRYRDGKFHNTEPLKGTMENQPLGKRLGIISEFFSSRKKAERVPPGTVPVESPLAAWSKPAETGLRATWLGHSTVLLEIDGVRVLTDPVWGERVSPVDWAGPKRFHPAPVAIDQLPNVDVVVISHDHFDHLDYPTMLELSRMAVPFVTSLGVGAHLEAWGVAKSRITELEWWESTSVRGLTITATPARHFSGRGTSQNQTAWSSWSMRGERNSVFFSGDTGLTSEFEQVRERVGAHDLVMLEVGAYHPAWGQIHLGPDNALIAHRMLGGGALLPVHWGTFDLGLHPWGDPIETLAEGAAAQRVHLLTPRLGRAIEPARVSDIDPWWRAVAAAGADAPKTSASDLIPHLTRTT